MFSFDAGDIFEFCSIPLSVQKKERLPLIFSKKFALASVGGLLVELLRYTIVTTKSRISYSNSVNGWHQKYGIMAMSY